MTAGSLNRPTKPSPSGDGSQSQILTAMDVDRSFSQWSTGSPRIKWSAVFAGWALGLALQMMLTLAGLGLGAWAVDFHEANPTEGIPVGAAVWTGLSLLVSAFVSGYMTARCTGSGDRDDGLYHGLVVWGVTWLVFAWLTTTAMATMIGGAFSLFGTTLQTVVQSLSHPASSTVQHNTSRVTLSVDDVRREIESVLRATGKTDLPPESTPRDKTRAIGKTRQPDPLSRITDESLSELREKLSALDHQAAVNLMVNRYRMSDAQARDVVQSTIGILKPAQETVRGVNQRAAALGAEALDRLGLIALWLSGLGLISLAMSAIGGMVGTPEEALLQSTTHTESYRDIRRAS